jgi:isochorismate synthase
MPMMYGWCINTKPLFSFLNSNDCRFAKVSLILHETLPTFAAMPISHTAFSSPLEWMPRLTVSEQARLLFSAAIEGGLPMAFWRLPLAEKWQGVVGLTAKNEGVRSDLEELGSGFLVSPFINEGTGARFIPADIQWDSSGQWHFSPSLSDAAVQHFGHLLHQQPYISPTATLPTVVSAEGTSEKDFKRWVNAAVADIGRGQFQKVVLSRTKQVALPEGFEALKAFEQLCALYPTAFVSLIFLPGYGVWMGASPEVLISVENGIFRTMALAGTQAKGRLKDLNEARWRQKEIEEQALVSRYIINCFKKIRVREFDEYGPKTVEAGHLIHLRTDFAVDTQTIRFPNLGTVMLGLLHPTSAVCGMPLQPALQFILRTERHPRELYSGYLGPVNMQGVSKLFVNLRCMRLAADHALIYAGCGITEGSSAVREWRETEIKSQTMSRILVANG